MSQSNVGSSAIYEKGDQINRPQSEVDRQKQEARFHEGKQNSHLANDPKDERSIANKLAREEKREKEPESDSLEVEQSKKDPTLPAKFHGNEPSKGAKVDADIQAEEEEILKKKGNFGPN